MIDPLDALSDLLLAAARARDLAADVAAADARARALATETNWQARAARSFREAIRSWGAELVGIRLRLDDLADEATAAAASARRTLDLQMLGVPR